jgi:hypothetical protein
MRANLTLCVLTATALALSSAEAGRLLRWVDDEGKVHYSDKIPPEYVDQAREELNTQGVQVREIPRAKTREEVERERELQRLRQERERLVAEQRAADRVLLRTFRSEDDLMLARDGKLTAIDVQIQVTQGNIRRHQKKLSQLQHKAATLERSGRPVPDQLRSGIASTLNSINEAYAAIEQREQEKNAIRAVFERDLRRFRELKNLGPGRAADDVQAGQRRLDNLVDCADARDCARAWGQAERFVRQHATTPMQMLGESIIMTAPPVGDRDISITVSRLRGKTEGGAALFMDLFCKDSPLGREFCGSEQVRAIRQGFRAAVEAAP